MESRGAEVEREHDRGAEARTAPGTAPESQRGLLRLQRTAGNRAVAAMLGAQTKTNVGCADDPFEREADSVAQRVVEALAQGSSAPAAQHRVDRHVQRTGGIGAEGGTLDPATERSLQAARGGGHPLPPEVQQQVGGAIGADFSHVRLHAGAEAIAQLMQAQPGFIDAAKQTEKTQLPGPAGSGTKQREIVRAMLKARVEAVQDEYVKGGWAQLQPALVAT